MGSGPEQIFFQRSNIDDQKTYKKMLNSTSNQGNANQNHPLTPVKMSIIRKTTNYKCWQGCGEKGTFEH